MRLVKGAGEAQTVLKERVYSPAGFAPAIRARLELHGFSTLCQQRCSQIKDYSAKLDAMDEIVARLGEGQWEAEAKARGAQVVSIEVEALARLKGESIAAVQKSLAGYEKEKRAKIFAHKSLAPFIEAIRKERESAESTVSLDDLAE
jgi:protein subunit release factor B